MGRVICCGLGPGDPELLTVRADRLVRTARRIAYFRKAGRRGQARRIVADLLDRDVVEYPMEYPVTTELPFDGDEYACRLAAFYDSWTERVVALAAEADLVVLCEGDPFLYGSFMHLWVRLRGRVAVEVVPGVPGMAGCWNVAELPMTWGDDVLSVVAGTLPAEEIARRARDSDALAIMKAGGRLPAIRAALEAAGRLDEAVVVECGTMPEERVTPLGEVGERRAPYFSTVLVPGSGRRPCRAG